MTRYEIERHEEALLIVDTDAAEVVAIAFSRQVAETLRNALESREQEGRPWAAAFLCW